MTIEAIYENGVFRPTEPVDLPDHTKVTIRAEVTGPIDNVNYSSVWNCLSNPVDTGIHDLAELHNEHQP